MKKEIKHLIWQAGILETYQNMILGQLLVINGKKGKRFGRLQASALQHETSLWLFCSGFCSVFFVLVQEASAISTQR